MGAQDNASMTHTFDEQKKDPLRRKPAFVIVLVPCQQASLAG